MMVSLPTASMTASRLPSTFARRQQPSHPCKNLAGPICKASWRFLGKLHHSYMYQGRSRAISQSSTHRAGAEDEDILTSWQLKSPNASVDFPPGAKAAADSTGIILRDRAHNLIDFGIACCWSATPSATMLHDRPPGVYREIHPALA